ncbi:hypothetical protein D3C71_2097680 [compost metagenome]
MQGIEHTLKQHVGGGHQRIRQMTQALEHFFHQLLAALAAERLAVLDQYLALEAVQRFFEAGRAFLADTQLGARADQGDLLGQRVQ